MNIKIEQQDIEGSGHGSHDDPLARALNRSTGHKWSTEIYSRGMRMRSGGAWDESTDYSIDPETTRALQEFDVTKAFTPRTAILTVA